MASHDDDRLDFGKLQRELDSAVEQDARYWRENDAKIRAVSTQRVATYDEFKDMVAASHLKPLNKGDHIETINEISKHPWNPAADRNKQINSTPDSQSKVIERKRKVPGTGQEFARDWQREVKTSEQRYAYLLDCGACRLAQLFKAEVSFGLLGDILTVLAIFHQEDVRQVLDILESLRASARFSLSLQFLSAKEKEVCSRLFESLGNAVQEPDVQDCRDSLAQLRDAYLPS